MADTKETKSGPGQWIARYWTWGLGLLLVLVILLVMVVLFQTVIQALRENILIVLFLVMLAFGLLAIYFLLRLRAKPTNRRALYLLKLWLQKGPGQGLVEDGIDWETMPKSPTRIKPHWIPEHDAVLWVGEIMGPGSTGSVLISNGKTIPEGESWDTWDWAFMWKHIRELRRKNTSIEEALATIEDMHAAEEARRKQQSADIG